MSFLHQLLDFKIQIDLAIDLKLQSLSPTISSNHFLGVNNIISDEEQIANIMNNYFINVTKTLNLKKQLGVGCSGINEFENHISIKMIHEKYLEILPESFKFQLVSNNEVKKEIENFDTKKSSTYGSIPATILKLC